MFSLVKRHLPYVGLALISWISSNPAHSTEILNVSYDVSRDFYKDYNPAFTQHWQKENKAPLQIKQSHGGSTKQARAVIDGLDADVVTMNQATDVIAMANKGLVANDWRTRFANNASPYTSVMIFVVRKGNPKGIKNWADLTKTGTSIIMSNPKTSGNGRYTYLAAWGAALKTQNNASKAAEEYMAAFAKNVPLLAAGGRDATTTFMQRKIGDVLITFESEAELIAKEFGRGEFEMVYPTVSIVAEFPVAVVDPIVDKKQTRKLATAYLDYLWSTEGQEIAAQNYLRPRNAAMLQKYTKQFPSITTFTVEDTFDGWPNAMKNHFADGATFDRLFTTKK